MSALTTLGARPLAAADELSSLLPWWSRVATERWLASIRAALLMVRPRSLWRLRGAASVDGRPLEVVTDLGDEALAYWSALLFADEPARTSLGTHRVHARLALGRGADLTLVSHPRTVRRHARGLGYVTVPTWLDTGLAIASSVDATLAASRYGRRSRLSDLRRIRRADLAPAIVRDAAEITAFLHDWYLPFVHARWRESCVGLDAGWMQRAPRYCELLWVMRGSQRLAGLLLEPQGDTLRMIVVGMTDASCVRDGALAAVYYFAIGEAVRRRKRLLRTGGTRPVLGDRVLEFKRKWGAGIRRARQQDYLAVGFREWSPTVRALFTRHPVVVETSRDGFFALTDPMVVLQAANSAVREMSEIEGLQGVLCPAGDGAWMTHPFARRS
jgi:hypothetical protein